MKKLLLLAIPAVLVACAENPTQPASDIRPSPSVTTLGGLKPSKGLVCHDGTTDGGFGGVCTVFGKDNSSATLDNSDPQIGTANYAYVYSLNFTVYGSLLTDIGQLSYHYTGNIVPQPGNLSYNIPIDVDGNTTTDFVAFVDAFHCPGNKGTVHVTTDAVCRIFAGSPGPDYPNWAAFIAAYPGASVPNNCCDAIFIIAERTLSEPEAVWTINGVKFDKP